MSRRSSRSFWYNLWQNIHYLFTHDLYDVMKPLINATAETKPFQQRINKQITELAATNQLLNATNQHLDEELVLLKSAVHSLNARITELNGLGIPLKHIFSIHTPRPAFNTTVSYSGTVDVAQFDNLLALNKPRCGWYAGSTLHHQQIDETPFRISCWSTPKHSKEICEDALIIDIHKNELFCAVADGVSHSVCSYLAASYVCKYLHFEWKTALQNDEFSIFSLREKSEQLVREALYQAKFHAHIAVSNEIATITDEIVHSTLTQIHANVGTQATFACVFTIQSFIVCIWMGNTRITCYDHMSNQLIDISDRRFDDDKNRFSSISNSTDSSIGVRGQIYVEIIDARTIPSWNMLIFSDALENHKQKLIADSISLFAHSNQNTIDYTAIINDAAALDDTTLALITFQSNSPN
jgi:hypothetical protein